MTDLQDADPTAWKRKTDLMDPRWEEFMEAAWGFPAGEARTFGPEGG